MRNFRFATSNSKRNVSFLFVALFLVATVNARTKRLERPSGKMGIASVDRFVIESFDLYDKVYMYDGYAKSGTPLEDNDLDILTNALEDVQELSESAVDIASEIDGVGLLKQSKVTLQIGRTKKPQPYGIKTSKELLLGACKNVESETDKSGTSSSQYSDTSDNENSTNNQNEEISSKPLNDNTTANGKAQNRRLEFEKNNDNQIEKSLHL